MAKTVIYKVLAELIEDLQAIPDELLVIMLGVCASLCTTIFFAQM